MKKIFKKLNSLYKVKKRGFIVPMTLLITTIILTIATGISVIITKEIFFGRLGRESKLAYYAADTAMSCASSIDEKYIDSVTGLGIFRSATTTEQDVIDRINQERSKTGLLNIALTDIKCGTSLVFDTASNSSAFSVTDFTRNIPSGGTEAGKKSSFKLKMSLGDGTYRCASVVVNKTPTYRQIISRGFSSCDTSSNATERAIINTSEVN